MSYQVGLSCYADLPAAGAAACSQFQPITGYTNNGMTITTSTCATSTALGSLQLKISTLPVAGGPAMVVYANQQMVYQPCMYQDFVDAGLLIFVALLSAWVVCWGTYQIYKFLHWSRGDL